MDFCLPKANSISGLSQFLRNKIEIVNLDRFNTVTNGFVNEGVYCYMNVVLQCLLSTPGIKEYFISGLHKKDTPPASAFAPAPLSLVSSLFAELVTTYFSFRDVRLDPIGLKNCLKLKSKRFNGVTQEDAHEFMIFLIHLIEEEFSTKTNPKMNYEGSKKTKLVPVKFKRKEDIERTIDKRDDVDSKTPEINPLISHAGLEMESLRVWKKESSQGRLIFGDVMRGQTLSTLICTTCGFNSYTFEPFYMFELPIPSHLTNPGIIDCLQAFSQEEIIDCLIWTCEKCNEKRAVKKCSKLWKLPPVFAVSLKRFKQQGKEIVKDENLITVNLNGEDFSSLFDANDANRHCNYKPFAFIVQSHLFSIIVEKCTRVITPVPLSMS